MPTVWYVAWIVMCFHGDCTRFESAPYYKNVSHEMCQRMLNHTFVTTVGPYYDERIDFTKDSPEDIKIQNAGCDVTDRRPEDDDGRNWRIESDDGIEPRDFELHRDEKQGDIRKQQQKEHLIE